ncbi:ricin-type beta-trefoil lectin domain protein [Kitasatospora sp. NPDC017646]|uniref:ricin-type beta-trefoil lectin domain protein n=1 Tax=Kitasatospora sp. NPDC017646 TaxID=3364024 RepID=UPI0037AF72F9
MLAAPTALAAEPTAASTHGPVGGVGPVVPSTPAPPRTPLQQAMLDAIAKAKSTGKPVVVDAMTDVASKTVANPNGTLSTTDNAQPVRVKRDGKWADLDPTLKTGPDGTVTPAVLGTAVSFSGGGTGPMATATTEDGNKLAVGAPFALPKPTLNGATATYADVLPGVNLQLTALTAGGWRDVIVVRTPEAAANPALKTLRFPVTANGLTVAADDKGAISVKDDKSGKVRFQAPAPMQWDSSKPASATPPKAGKAVAAPAAEDAGAQGAPSTAEAPGDGAKVALIGTKATSEAIELTPDPAALGSGTGPWFLDPTLIAVSNSVQSSVEVQENHKDAKNFNLKSDLATGYCGFHSSDPNQDCGSEGRQRAYFQFTINPAIYTVPGGAEVPPTLYSSVLNAQVSGASSMGTATNLGVYSAPRPIDGNTNWYQQPCGDNGNVVMDGCSYVGGQQITGTGPMSVDVSGMINQAAAGHWPWWTLGIAPSDSEWKKEFRHQIASNPSITTNYDITPTIWYPRTSPAPGFADTGAKAECTSGGAHPWDNSGWVGNNQNIYLTANSYSPAGQPLYTGYIMWDDQDPNFRLEQGGWGGSYNNPAPSTSVGSLTDGHQYGWLARSTDTLLTSPNSAWCYFRVDKTAPRVSISSTDFPPSGTPNPNPAKYVGDMATFTINADDPAPGPNLWASGVACIRVTPDPTPVVGWGCNPSDTIRPGQSYTYQPRQWGTNTLYAWAMDVAGNYSQAAVYNFYVPWRPHTQPLFGDVDNDQKPDIVLTDKTGDLRVIGGTAEPSTSLAAPASAAPDGSSWADFQISHHGTLAIGQAVDEIVAHYNKDTTSKLREPLYLIPNRGTGRFDALKPIPLTRPSTCTTYGTGKPCPDYTPKVWSNVSQAIAFGTPEGEAVAGDPKDPNHKIINSQASILTVENNNLYLFQPNGTFDDLDSATLIPTASGSWADLELLSPGPANGTTTSTDKTNPGQVNQTTLWARNRTTGDVFAYPLGWNTNGTVDYTALTKPDAGIKLTTGVALTAANYPHIGAGDINADGYPDLWTVDNNNAITIYSGQSSTGTTGKVDGFGTPSMIGYADASTSIHPSLVPWQCMDAEGGPRDGAPLAIYSCWNTPNQRYNLGADGTIRAGAYCVSTTGDATTNGTQLVLARCADKPTQKWTTRTDGRIVNNATITNGDPNTGRCAELHGWATDQGTRLDIWDCPNLQENLRWSLQPERTP